MVNYDIRLRGEVEKIFGQKIVNSTHCDQLSKLVFSTTGISVSSQTFRRFWELIEYKNKISLHCKNALCKFIGYDDYYDFIAKSNKPIDDISKEIDFNVIQNIILDNKINDKNLELWNEGISVVLAKIIFSHQHIFESFVQKLHTNPYAMDYIIGLFQCYHLLSQKWYLKGLRVFCNHSTVSHHKMYLYSMESIERLLAHDYIGMKVWIKKMQTISVQVRKEYGIIYPLDGACMGLQLVYFHSINDMSQKTELISKAEHIIIKNYHIQNEYGDTIAAFNTHLIEILIWAGLYEDAYYFFKKFGLNTNQYKHYQYTIIQSTYIFKGLLYVYNKEISKAQDYAQKVDINLVRFDKKPLLECLFLLLKWALIPMTAQVRKEKQKNLFIKSCDQYGFESIKAQLSLL